MQEEIHHLRGWELGRGGGRRASRLWTKWRFLKQQGGCQSLVVSSHFLRGPCDWKIQSRLSAWNLQSTRLKFSIQAWTFQSPLKTSISIENFSPRLNISILLEVFNLAWKLLSRPWQLPTKGALLCGPLEICNLDWNIQFQSSLEIFNLDKKYQCDIGRLKSSILRRAVPRSSRGPCYQRDLPMKRIIH